MMMQETVTVKLKPQDVEQEIGRQFRQLWDKGNAARQVQHALHNFLVVRGIWVVRPNGYTYKVIYTDKTEGRKGIHRHLPEHYTTAAEAYIAALALLPDFGVITLVGEDREPQWVTE